MKPAPFEYFAPATREEALALLAAHGGEAEALAGGQSLVPSMNFRLAQPGILVDLNGIADLFGIASGTDGGLRLGAMTRQRTAERSTLVAGAAPPAAELPALAVALDAELRAQRAGGAERRIPAAEFFQGLFTTALDAEELLVEIRIPARPQRTGPAFAEFARRHGDSALAGVAAVVPLAADGAVAACRLVF